jgi:hypothetical protein
MKQILFTFSMLAILIQSSYADEKRYDDDKAGIHITYPSDWVGPIKLSLNTVFRSPEGIALMIGSFPGDASLPDIKRGIHDAFFGGNSVKIEAPIDPGASNKELTCIKAILPSTVEDNEIPEMYSCLAINGTRAYIVGLAGRSELTTLRNPVFIKAVRSLLEMEP